MSERPGAIILFTALLAVCVWLAAAQPADKEPPASPVPVSSNTAGSLKPFDSTPANVPAPLRSGTDATAVSDGSTQKIRYGEQGQSKRTDDGWRNARRHSWPLSRMTEIQEEMIRLESQQSRLISELAALKKDAGSATDQKDKWRLERQVREKAGQLHDLIEQHMALERLKGRFLARAIENPGETRSVLEAEIERLKHEITSAKNSQQSADKAQAQLNALKVILEDFQFLLEHPDLIKRVTMPPAPGMESDEQDQSSSDAPNQKEWRPGWRFLFNRQDWANRFSGPDGPQPPKSLDPADVEGRLDRLERELLFLEVQSSRIEREIALLRELVQSRKKPSEPDSGNRPDKIESTPGK